VMYPGFSGGPLVNAAGQVIGMNTSGLLRNATVTLLEPVLKRVVGELLAHGHMRRGYLGVGSQPVRLPEALAQSSALQGQETGLLISSVQPGSPAEKAGLMLGDTLVALAGRPMGQMDDLLVYLNGDVVGQAVQATVVRGGAIQNLNLVVGER
jgi:S1-C subfamily serine protease